MKIEQQEVGFKPIQITIESAKELKWFIAIANTSETKAKESGTNIGLDMDEHFGLVQMELYNKITKLKDQVNE